MDKDLRVLSVQQWVNRTYGTREGFDRCAEDGFTGNATFHSLVQALQFELGVTADGDFGPTTMEKFKTLSPESEDSNQIMIMKGACWCKGYNCENFNDTYDDHLVSAIKDFQRDAGLTNQDGVITNVICKALMNTDAYTIPDSSPEKMHKIQQIERSLNGKYSDVYGTKMGLVPCDGIYSRQLCKAMIYAVQIEGGSDPDGLWGNNTLNSLPTLGININTDKKDFILLLQYALYLNGFDPNGFDGLFGGGAEKAVADFQRSVALDADGIAGRQTWAALLVSYGDVNRTCRACDTATVLTQAQARTIRSQGYEVVGRYLTGYVGSSSDGTLRSKAITPAELSILYNEGLKVFPIYQTTGRSSSYFTVENAYTDAYTAWSVAQALGFPDETIIYFAVDFDAYDYEVSDSIIPYFKAVSERMAGYGHYRVGIYGARNICTRVSDQGYAVSSFVGDMSSGYGGNLGHPIPSNWAFDQIQELWIGEGDGRVAIDRDVLYGAPRDTGVLLQGNTETPVEIGAVKQMDIQALKGQHRYVAEYYSGQTGTLDIDDYTYLAALQAVYVYYIKNNDYEKTDELYRRMCEVRKSAPDYRSIYQPLLDSDGEFKNDYPYYTSKKTAKVIVNEDLYFTKEVLQEMRLKDDIILVLISLIPKCGNYISDLMSFIRESELSENISIFDLLIDETKNGVLDYAKKIELITPKSDTIFSVFDGLYGAIQEYETILDIQSYIKNDVKVFEGDSYIELDILFDLGVERDIFTVFLRDGNPFVIKDYHAARMDSSSISLGKAKSTAQAWKDNGYSPSEKHGARSKEMDEFYQE